jgi:hypothetical protein
LNKELLKRLEHPYYCVWCGEILSNSKEFKKHSRLCANDTNDASEPIVKDRVGDIILDKKS